MTSENTPSRASRKVFSGVVVSDKTDKTRVVSVERWLRHAEYGKTVKRSTRYHAHDENNETREGDLVEIMSTRPMSRLKRWRISRVITKAEK